MQASERFGRLLVVACQPSEQVEPAESARDDPAARQQDNVLWDLGQFDSLEVDTFLKGGLCRRLARITLIGKRPFTVGPVTC